MKTRFIEQVSCIAEKCYPCDIRQFALFADLQREDFDQLHLPIESFELLAGESLYLETDEPGYVYTIRSGLVKLVHYLPNGSYKIARLLYRGDLVGIEALSDSNYLQNAIALQNTAICRISVEEIKCLNHTSPHLYKQLAMRWQKIQSDAHIWLTQFTVGSSRKRVANLLLYLAENSEEESFYLPSREDVGALLSITAATASRIIAEFKRHDFLRIKGENAVINKAKFEQIC